MTVSRNKGLILSSAETLTFRTARPSGLVTLALLGAMGLTLAGCSGVTSTTYGTGETHEKELLDDVTGLLGVLPGHDKKGTIDYNARAGLVLPPEGAPLPDPRNKNDVPVFAKADWPQDPDVLRKAYTERMESMTDKEREQLLEAIRRLPPEQRDSIIKNNTASANFAKQIQEPNLDKGPANPYEQRRYDAEVKRRLALIRAQKEGEKGKRTYLTQPPERFTEMSPEVASEIQTLKQQEKTTEKKSFFSRLWPFGKKE
nr:hypothetical protein [uncultured Cohaesibacter sp.]